MIVILKIGQKCPLKILLHLEWGKVLTKHFIVIISPQKNKKISPIGMQNKTLSLADRDHFQNLLIDKLYDP